MLASSTVSWGGGVNLFDIILKLLVAENNQIIYLGGALAKIFDEIYLTLFTLASSTTYKHLEQYVEGCFGKDI